MTRLCGVSHHVLFCQLLESAWSGELGTEHPGEIVVSSCWHVWQVLGLPCGSPSVQGQVKDLLTALIGVCVPAMLIADIVTDVDAGDPIEIAKHEVRDRHGVPVGQRRLVHATRQVEGGRRVPATPKVDPCWLRSRYHSFC